MTCPTPLVSTPLPLVKPSWAPPALPGGTTLASPLPRRPPALHRQPSPSCGTVKAAVAGRDLNLGFI